MQFGSPLTQKTNFREKADHWFAPKAGKFPRRRYLTLTGIFDAFIECSQGLNRIAPSVALIWHKLLQNSLCCGFSIVRLVFEEAGNPGNLPKADSFRQESADLKVRVLPFFDTPEEFQDKAFAVNDRA